ncbi:MAG: nucleoside-diphosphate kinase [Marine Group II euryarchaeote MED-G38]|nr:nucleoside-diphosphate kinase [Euryarchaeota archaeon]OUV25823.1 MAG: nucleoside-diphosphate kinase [Euryarchaeota archaeon TMED97]PDH23572.1 MAG: nucleoside-diphosphate kinase [Marine Group II euryarchaeote MED-G38]
MQTTYIMIKPDGVQRGLVGEIITRFENKGLRLVGLRQLIPSSKVAEEHYAIHKDRPFYSGLIKFITSGPVVAMAWTGVEAIKVARNIIGPTNGREASPGTIRGDLAMDIGHNIIHGSDGEETAKFELELWFPNGLSEWRRDAESQIYE